MIAVASSTHVRVVVDNTLLTQLPVKDLALILLRAFIPS